jgi:hypothetical protein
VELPILIVPILALSPINLVGGLELDCVGSAMDNMIGLLTVTAASAQSDREGWVL